jgi:hypothetical protein
MTDEDKKLVFEYIVEHLRKRYSSFNNNRLSKNEFIKKFITIQYSPEAIDMVAAMNKMVEKGDWKDFDSYSCRVFVNDNSIKFNLKKETWTSWLMQPTRFFELMSSWLKEKENDKGTN